MAENDDYGIPDVEFSPIDRGSQGNPNKSTQSNKKKMTNQRKTDSKAPVIIAIVVIIILVIVAGYFFIIKPSQVAAEKEKIALEEQQALESEAEAEKARQEEEDLLVAEAEEARFAEEEAELAEPETGSVTVLSEKTGRSYVIVGSFFDGDMAHDAGNKLASEGVSTYILEPAGEVRFYRLAVEGYDSFGDALAAVDDYSATYGSEIWALKY